MAVAPEAAGVPGLAGYVVRTGTRREASAAEGC